MREVAPYVVAAAKVLLTLTLFLIGAGLSRAALTKIATLVNEAACTPYRADLANAIERISGTPTPASIGKSTS